MIRLRLGLATAVVAIGLTVSPWGRTGMTQNAVLSPEYLRNPAKIELGKKVWANRCQFCHGKAAYPGKAPKLNPSRYTPEFVYDRVTNGFGGMPGWKQEFSEDELKAVVAYVLSKDFSN